MLTNIGDFWCGDYLFIVWIGDLQYGREFIVNEMKWRNGVLCTLAFVLILMFSLVIPYLLSLLSFARYMVVVHPMESKFRSASFVFNCVFSRDFYFTSHCICFCGHLFEVSKK